MYANKPTAPTENQVQHVAAVPYQQHVEEIPDETLQRKRWHRISIFVIVASVVYIVCGAMNIAGKGNGNPGACCLPRGCDVSKLKGYGDSWKANQNGRYCQFTDAELAVMGCPATFQETQQKCELSPIPNKHGDTHNWQFDQCTNNDAVGKMIGSGVPLIVMGGLSIITALCFFLPGYTCFGPAQARKTCCNWTARISTGCLWSLVWSGAIVGIVFGSLLTYRLNHPYDTHETCHTDNNSPFCKDKDHHGLYWTGDSCPASIKNTPADVFSWITPSDSQKRNAHITIVLSVGFILFTFAVMVRAAVRACNRCNKRQQQSNTAAPGTNYVAVGQPQANYTQPMYTQQAQPQAPFATAAAAGPYYGTAETTQGQVLVQEQPQPQPQQGMAPPPIEYPTKPQPQAAV